MNVCHECSKESRRWTVGLVTAAIVLGISVAVLGGFHLLRETEDAAGAACLQPIFSCHKWLARAIPLSAIKIVVVVLQIITQVGFDVVDLKHSCLLLPLKRVNVMFIVCDTGRHFSGTEASSSTVVSNLGREGSDSMRPRTLPCHEPIPKRTNPRLNLIAQTDQTLPCG